MIGKNTLLEFFKISPTPSLLLQIDSPKFTIAEVNEAYLDATKSTREDLLGKEIFEAFPDNDYDTTADGVKNLSHSLQTVVQTNKRHKMAIQKYDIPIRGTSKFELKYWKPENIPLMNNNGKLKYIIHCVKDVTEKVTAKKQAKEFEYFFNNTNDFSCIANTEGYFEIVNLSFNNAFGYLQNELEKEPFINFVHPDDIADTLKVYDKLKSGATIIHFINRYRKKDGSYLFLDWSAAPNPVTGKLYCIARDITERKKADEDLKLLNEELEQRVKERTEEAEKALKENTNILESIGDAFFAVDSNWKVTYWNHIAERDLSVLKNEILGKNLWDVFSDSIDSKSYKKYHEAAATNQVVHFEDYYLALNKWYEISAYPSEIGLAVYFKDITERIELEHLLIKANTLAKIGSWEVDLLKGTVYWNDITREIHEAEPGFVPGIATGINFYKEGPGRDLITEKVKEAVELGKPWDVELQIITAKNNERWIRTIGETEFVDGKCVKIYGSFQDIDKRKKAEIETERLNERLKLAMLSEQLGLWDWDIKNNKLIWDEEMYRLYNLTPNEFTSVYEGWTSRVHEEDRQRADNEIQLALENKKDYNPEFRIVWPDLSVHYINASGIIERDNDGNAVRMTGFNWDVTERKEAEEKLIESEKLFRDLFQNMRQGFAYCKGIIENGKVVDYLYITVNTEYERIFQVENINGKKLSEVFPESITADPSYSQVLQEVVLQRKSRKFETCYIPSKKWLSVTFYNAENENFVLLIEDITESKESKELIEKSNERFDYVTKATFDAIWDWDINTNTIYWGEGFEKIFGYNLSELKDDSDTWTKNIHPDDLEKITQSYYNTVKSNTTNWIEEYRYKKSNGKYAYIINKGIVIRDSSGRAIRIIGAMQDITQKKQEEQRLKLLESVITNTNDAVVIKEAKPSSELGRKIVYVNESFTHMTGYTSDEIIGRTHKLLQGPNTNEEELARLYKALDEWQPCEISIIYYNKQGKEYWVNLSLNPVTNSKGEYTHWISIERDITEKKNQEIKIKETTQTLLDTLESIQDGFYTLDSNWNVSYWNKEAERISGRTKEEMIGKNFWELYNGRISEKINKAFHKAKSNNKPIRFEVYSKQSKYWFELNAFPSEMGLTVYFKNITERKHTESKLKKVNRSLENHVKELAISNQELEQFAYVASHDLQEPLRMITSFLTQIEKKYEAVLDEKGKKYIFFAVDGAKRMRQIILDLLEFSRVGKNENRNEKVDLNTIIEEIILLYRKQIEEKKAKINYEALPILQSCAAPLRQVFQNLISNSLKYSSPDIAPIINISCSNSATSWIFEIKDNGIGINPEYYDKIFIVFQRLHSKEEYSGTGMGLAIAKKIIENLRGQIWVKSEEGKGTSFYFTIPKK